MTSKSVVAASMGAAVRPAILSLALIALTGWGQGPADVVNRGKQAFEEFYFLTAKRLFAEAVAEDPSDAEAAYGYARSAAMLHEYEEAIPAFARALGICPDDPRCHEGLINALLWGGVFRGRRDWLDRAIEAGADSIRAFPNLAPLYESVEFAAGELNESMIWLDLLESLEPEVGGSPVYRVRRLGAQLARAKSVPNEALVEACERELRDLLEEAARTDARATAAGLHAEATWARYQLAYGHQVLGEVESEREWLLRLDELEEGRHLATRGMARAVYGSDFRTAIGESRDAAFDVLKREESRFPPPWDNPDLEMLRPLLRNLLSILGQELISRFAASPSVSSATAPGGTLAALSDEELLDQVVETAERYGRLVGVGGYSLGVRFLTQAGRGSERALQLADAGLARIAAGESGLFYPGTPADELESERRDWSASLLVGRAMALRQLGRRAEAEAALKTAVGRSPRADRFARLGDLLVAEGDREGAYEAFVTALAWNTEQPWLRDESAVRQQLVSVARELGVPESEVEAELAEAAARAAAERRARVVNDRVEIEAPGFDLADLEGTRWRLSELIGKVVVLNYWATWCAPCREEFPHYRELVEEYSEAPDVVFLAISTDTDQAAVRKFVAEHEYAFTVLFDEGSSIDFQVTGIPEHFVIGPNGRIQYRWSGVRDAERYAREMRWRIEALRSR